MSALARVAALLLRVWGSTWRIHFEGPDPFVRNPAGPHIGACLHRDLLITAYAFRDRGFSVPVSRSRDGDLISALLGGLGYDEPTRGSSSRAGASALRALVRKVRAGTTVSVQVDGPRGPAGVPKPGVLHLARLSGVPITPLSFHPRRTLAFGSWDRTRLPLPFTAITATYHEAIEVPSELDDAEETRLLELLRDRLG